MPDSPLLTRKATIAAGTAIGFGEIDGWTAARAFLAAQDPEALVESYNEGGSPDLSELSGRDRRLLGDYNCWLRLGGDDA